MGGLSLDTGALLALEKKRKGMTEVVETARLAHADITVPARLRSPPNACSHHRPHGGFGGGIRRTRCTSDAPSVPRGTVSYFDGRLRWYRFGPSG